MLFRSNPVKLGLSAVEGLVEQKKTPQLPRKKIQVPEDAALEHIIDLVPSYHADMEIPASNSTVSHSSETISNHSVSNSRWYDGLTALIQGGIARPKSKFHILKKGNTELDKEILGYIRKINETIGYYWWKQYFYTGFWSYISTPINLAITVLTALTTGQSATQGLITTNTATILGGIVLCLSIFNTFFKPNDQMNTNRSILRKWADMGTNFDKVYFDKVSDDDNKEKEKKEKLKKLQDLFKEVSQLKKDNDSNFLIDILYSCLRCICLRNGRLNWSQDLSASDEEDI